MQRQVGKVWPALLALLLVAVGGLIYLAVRLDFIVADLIETQGSEAIGSDVRVTGVSIDLKSASAELSGLTVANPGSFPAGTAVELGSFAITMDPASITSDTIVLRDVTVRGATVNLMREGGTSNLQLLLGNLRVGEMTESNDEAPARKLIIDRFTLEDARGTVTTPELDEVRAVTVPTIVVTDIGRASNGATAAAVARLVLEPMFEETLKTAAGQELKDRAQEKVDEAKDRLLDNLLEQLRDNDNAPQD